MANKGFPGFESRGEEITVPALHCPRFMPAPTSPTKFRKEISDVRTQG